MNAGETGAAVGRAAGPGAGVVARPGLAGRLAGPARVTVVVAPAGSGKTVLLRSWISQEGLSERAAWVPAGRDERDPQPFWLAVVAALRRTTPGSVLVQALTAAPDLDGWATTERLLTDLAPLAEPLWLVIDDVHELAPELLRQLELLVMRAPPQLRFVLAARHDVRLGLHRLRLEGELAEIRAGDLRFSLAEAAELLAAAGVELPGPAVAVLHERTEGWAAGLRLAALAAAGHPDPAAFAAEFSGTERTVAEYLLAEVLDRQPGPVRRLLLRTSILERVNGELADLLTGEGGGERVLQDLAAASAFTMPLDAARTWFRYHQMFAGLLRLELRRTAPGEVAGLHLTAAGWFAAHGSPVEAVRHAQAAGDWGLAARLLAEHWPGLHLDGQDTTIHELLAGFPAQAREANAELAAVAAADELARGSLEAAERYLELAERALAAVPESRQGQALLLLGVVRLLRARQRGNPEAVAEQAHRLQAAAEAAGTARHGLGEDLRALALISLGRTEIWTTRYEGAYEHLQQGIALARRIGRPFLEFSGLADLAMAEIAGASARTAESRRALTRMAERARQAIELAERHGWTDEPAFGVACRELGTALAWQARPEEAEPWVQHAERTVTAEAEPATATAVCYTRGTLELARGRDQDALAAFLAAERLAGRLDAPNLVIPRARTLQLLALVRLGDTGHAEQTLAGLDDRARERGDVRIATAALRLAQDDPRAAAATLAPVLDGSAPLVWPILLALAFLLEASARDALGDQGAAGQALERALDLAEPDGLLLPFLLYPAPGLLERQARRRTAHASLVAEILGRLSGNRPAAPPAGPRLPIEPLSETELRVLRYLPTNLTGPEIAAELYVSHNTVKTHIHNLYLKLGTHRRAETVARARDLGLLAPTARTARLRPPAPPGVRPPAAGPAGPDLAGNQPNRVSAAHPAGRHALGHAPARCRGQVERTMTMASRYSDVLTPAGGRESAGPPRRPRGIRFWAWVAIAAQVLFVASWLAAASWQGPHYSVLKHSISDMYAVTAPHGSFLVVAFTDFGAATILFALFSVRPALRAGGPAAMVGAALLALSVAGLGDLLTPFERMACRLADPGCTTALQVSNPGGKLDGNLTTIGVLALVAAGLFLARAMRRIPSWQAWARPTRATAVLILALTIADALTPHSGLSGLFERLVAATAAAAITALAVGILRRSRT